VLSQKIDLSSTGLLYDFEDHHYLPGLKAVILI